MYIIEKPTHNKFRKTKIVATLGPACHNVEKMTQMIEAGMNCARFNFSHGDHAEHKSRYDMLHEAMKITGKDVALLLDTKGPEIRTAQVADKNIEVKKGQDIIVSGVVEKTSEGIIGLSYAKIHEEVQVGHAIKIADGTIVLEVKKIEGTNVHCIVQKNGILGSKKNVNIPEATINLPSISEKDKADIDFAIEHKYDYIAASFIRDARAVEEIRAFIKEKGSSIGIISKIENQEGLTNLESIIQVSDGIMIARGDLAEQIPPARVPLAQKQIITDCVKNSKITITATQMLQSMEKSNTPTRAELTDVANAIFDGTDAVMLSGETAQGDYPIEAIQTMHSVAIEVESSDQFRRHAEQTFFASEKDALLIQSDTGDSMIAAAQIVANKTGAAAFACPTLTGNSPRLLAALKPSQPILATTHIKAVYSRLLLVWGVCPVLIKESKTDEDLINSSIEKAREVGFLERNGKIVIIAGLPINEPLMLNTIKVYFEGSTLARGRQGCGKTLQGKYYRISNIDEIQEHINSHKETYIYCLPELQNTDVLKLKQITGLEGLLIERPSAVPMDVLEQQIPNIVCVGNIASLIFSPLNSEKEIIISGKEKVIYEP